MKRVKVKGIIFLIGVIILIGCKKEETTSPIIGGAVEGYIATKNGKFPLGGIHVYIKETPDKNTYSNSEGYFKIGGIEKGEKTLVISSGSIKVEKAINIQEGKTVTISDKNNPIKLGSELKIAVVYGTYDRIQEILDTIGFRQSYTPDTGAYVVFDNVLEFLKSSYLNDFNICFINCGALDEDTLYYNSDLKQKLITWISGGHSLYASDWAYTVIEACFPDYIDFFSNDTFPGSARQGHDGIIPATIQNEELKHHLGKKNVLINFNLPGWAIIDNVNSNLGLETWITADTIFVYPDQHRQNVPIMVHFIYNEGRVLYTSFHNEPQVTDDMVKILIRVIYGL